MALSAGLAWLVTKDGTSKRWEGFLLVGAYIGVVAVYYFS
jgi:Ca2+/Na+ antiporter